jgi:hypothetical protein
MDVVDYRGTQKLLTGAMLGIYYAMLYTQYTALAMFTILVTIVYYEPYGLCCVCTVMVCIGMFCSAHYTNIIYIVVHVSCLRSQCTGCRQRLCVCMHTVVAENIVHCNCCV